MTAAEYYHCIKALGMTPRRPSYQGATLYEDSDGEFHIMPDADTLSEAERTHIIARKKTMMGASDH